MALQDRPDVHARRAQGADRGLCRGGQEGRHRGLPLDPKAHFLENMKDVERGAGLWNTPLPVAHAMSFHDDKRCKTFTEVIVTQGGTPCVIGTRLYLHQGKVLRVDPIVTQDRRLAVQRQRLSQVHHGRGLGRDLQVPEDRAGRG